MNVYFVITLLAALHCSTKSVTAHQNDKSVCSANTVFVLKENKMICGGALVTDLMVITSCSCVAKKSRHLVLRETPKEIKILFSSGAEQGVDVIIPHPLCQITNGHAKFGTALVKMSHRVQIQPKVVIPLHIYTMTGDVLARQYRVMLTKAQVKCTVLVKPESELGRNSEVCSLKYGVKTNLNVKMKSPYECKTQCKSHQHASDQKCINNFVLHDLFCLDTSLGTSAQSCDPIEGMPLICENHIWGIMQDIYPCEDNKMFFYGTVSVEEIYSMAIKFSERGDCSYDDASSTPRSRNIGSRGKSMGTSISFSFTPIFIGILYSTYILTYLLAFF